MRTDLKGKGVNMMNQIDSAQDRDYWKALVNAALNLRVHGVSISCIILMGFRCNDASVKNVCLHLFAI